MGPISNVGLVVRESPALLSLGPVDVSSACTLVLYAQEQTNARLASRPSTGSAVDQDLLHTLMTFMERQSDLFHVKDGFRGFGLAIPKPRSFREDETGPEKEKCSLTRVGYNRVVGANFSRGPFDGHHLGADSSTLRLFPIKIVSPWPKRPSRAGLLLYRQESDADPKGFKEGEAGGSGRASWVVELWGGFPVGVPLNPPPPQKKKRPSNSPGLTCRCPVPCWVPAGFAILLAKD